MRSDDRASSSPARELLGRAGPRLPRYLGAFAINVVVAMLLASPVCVERALEHASFDDRLGTVPVEVGLAHNGVTTVDTGVFGRLYWERTGFAGFGAWIKVAGPPEAGGTLSSYVSPRFLKTNAAFVSDPGAVARAYGAELRTQVVHRALWYDVASGLVGGLLLTAVFRGVPTAPWSRRGTRRTRVALAAGGVVLGTAASAGVALLLFHSWTGSAELPDSYPSAQVDGLSFSSPQTREIAVQVQPFIEKNTERIEEAAAAFERRATTQLDLVLPREAAGLQPRDGEVVVLAEADPQGSTVGTRVRARLYELLSDELGDALVLRTISGDVSSNGTVAERNFVESEAEASPDIPVAAVKGDHDSGATAEQLEDGGVDVLDLEESEVGGLSVAGAPDPAFKQLFGGLVTNDSGTTEAQRGEELREAVDEDRSLVVLTHQPATAAGYLGIADLASIDSSQDAPTVPVDDGVPDVPPGIVNVGHRHDAEPPRVIWNTDGDQVTWTVVNQLGTSGGVEERPTFNRFSTPFSPPLKDISVQLQYVDADTGLQTGFADVAISPDGRVTVSDRTDLGLPGGEPVDRSSIDLR